VSIANVRSSLRAKRSNPGPLAQAAGLLRRGACHRAGHFGPDPLAPGNDELIAIRHSPIRYFATRQLSMPEQREQNDDRQRNAEQPEKNAFAHGHGDVLLI
jgi:hypothetical protein